MRAEMMSKTLKSVLLGSVAVSSAFSVLPAMSQQAQATDEKVTVTGSRIVRKNLTSVSPVSTLSNAEIKQTGTVSVEQLLNNSPLVVPNQTTEASNGATGIATVDLRGLGPQRTLVLINGRRMSPGNPLTPFPDLNAIPPALIQRVEVVTGGASAVYGSDALAGVVNFIMKKDFEGVQVDMQYGFAQHKNNDAYSQQLIRDAGGPNKFFPIPREDVTDAETFTASVTMGSNTDDGKGNVTLYANFTNFQALKQDERDFSACSITDSTLPPGFTFPDGTQYCLGSSNLNRITVIARNGVSTPGLTRLFITPSNDGIAANNTIATFASIADADKFYNFAPDNFLQRPRDTYQFGAVGRYEINKNLEVYAEAMFSDDTSRAQIAASGAFFSTPVTMNCDNPLMSAAQYAQLCTPAGAVAGDGSLVTVALGRRNLEGGPRQQDTTHSNYRIVTGARGEIAEGWNYDLYGQFGSTKYGQVYRNDWSISRVSEALQVNPLNPTQCLSGNPNCVPLDIFSGLGALTPAMVNFVTSVGVISGSVEEQIVSGSITGDLGSFGIKSPGSDQSAQIAAGMEYRRQALVVDPSDNFATGDLFGQGGDQPPANDHYDVFEGFVEVELPLVTDKTLFKLLSVNGGYRVSDYSEAGVTHSYKYGAEWAPTDDIRFRGSFNRATRAPNVLELFGPAQDGLFGGNDPCSGAVPAATLAQCINAGLTTPALQALYGLIPNCASSQCQTITSGNPNLKPEVSDTMSYGFVFTPTFLKGFSASVDYFEIEVNDQLQNVNQNVILFGCMSGGGPICANITRNPLTGDIATTGFGVTSVVSNAGSVRTQGIDIDVNYNLDLDSAGSLNLNYFGSITDSFEYAINGLTYDCAGLFGPTCGVPYFEYKHKARATWSSPWDVDLSVAWRHVSEAGVDLNVGQQIFGFPICGRANCGIINSAVIPAYDYFDLAGNWDISENYSLRFGVNNVADKDPPILDSNNFAISSPPFGNANTFPGVYDSLGREFFIGGTAKF